MNYDIRKRLAELSVIYIKYGDNVFNNKLVEG